MRIRMLVKFLNPYLFLAIGFLLFTNLGFSQTRISSPNLINTVWNGYANIPIDGGMTLDIKFVIQFKETGKFNTTHIFQLYGFRSKPRYNIYNNKEEFESVYTLLSSGEVTEIGKYEQNDNAVRLEFRELHIEATLKDSYMDGEVTYKASKAKARWLAEKFSNGAKQNETVKTSKPAPLSMEEKLPRQLGQFKRTNFKLITYVDPQPKNSTANADDPYLAALRETITPTRKNSEVEGAIADYGEITILIKRFEDSTKATAYLQDRFKTVSEATLRREPVKSITGQLVGELVLTKSPRKNEPILLAFTYGVFYYELFSFDNMNQEEDVQKIRKLLPLER